MQLDTAWWKVGYAPVADGVSLSLQAVNYALQLDVTTQQNLDQRAQLIEERDRLNQARVALAEHAARRQQAGVAVGEARQRVAAFEAENAELIREAAAEGERIAADVRVQRAYAEFLTLLRQYRAGLPGALMAGLNNMAMELYNEFNVRDAEQDKLCGLHLPVTGEGRIELNFRGAPEQRVDALQVLSEGQCAAWGWRFCWPRRRASRRRRLFSTMQSMPSTMSTGRASERRCSKASDLLTPRSS
ncbi:hypothetical protein [Pseudomonas aeruginosa]|uniref:hypothetical protein n=1 Tax=Pseudomonas aeruginosa TaxID=287 RepID=UPI001ED9B201|nr:hypothetical protein [Pseudomonas aeruginosa]